MTKCIGCGITLQSKNEKNPGYTPKENSLYCQRCFRLKNYNDYQKGNVKKSNARLIKDVNKDNIPCFFLIDFLNINNETINTFKKITAPKILVISKSDIIPKSLKLEKIKSYLENYYQIDSNIFFLSSKNKLNINQILKIMNLENINTSYILGYTNAGKSTLINNLLQANITTSIMPNTTLDYLNIKFDNYTLIDTPGFTYQDNFDDNIKLVKKCNPKKMIKNIIYQTKKEQVFRIEDLLELTSLENNIIVFYMSNDLEIKKTYQEQKDVPSIFLNIKENSDLVIKSVGFINIKKACCLKINTKYQSLLEVRDSIIGGK